jgi:hypothetical protein
LADYLSKYTGNQIDLSVSSGSTVSGKIIASGDISSSAVIIANTFGGELPTLISGSWTSARLPENTVSGSVQTLANLNDGIISGSTQLPSGIYSSSLQTLTHITASGQISASGNLYADEIYANGGNFNDGDITNVGSIDADSFRGDANGDNKISITSDTVDLRIEDTSVLTLKENQSTFTGHITASANISASGTITTEDLIVKDNATVAGDLDVADTIYHTGDSNTKIRFPEADKISFHTSGNEQMVISSGGHITASGNISGSSTSTGSFGHIEASGNIYANGHIVGDDGTNITNILSIALDSIKADANATTAIQVGNTSMDFDVDGETKLTLSTTKITVGDTVTEGVEVKTNITASGHISSSGNIETAYTGSFGELIVADDATIADTMSADYIVSNYQLIVNENGHGGGDFRVESAANQYMLYSDANMEAISIGANASAGGSTLGVTGDLTVTSHITSSGNISASGDISLGGGNLSFTSTGVGIPYTFNNLSSTALGGHNLGFNISTGSFSTNSVVKISGSSDNGAFVGIGTSYLNPIPKTLTVEGDISASGDFTGKSTSTGSFGYGIFTNLPTFDPLVTGSLWVSSSSTNTDNKPAGFVMVSGIHG